MARRLPRMQGKSPDAGLGSRRSNQGDGMNTHDIDIELPPLPRMRVMTGEYRASDMQDFARAAIEADRKRRGEPVNHAIRIYNSGYMAGHQDTVEGCF